MSRVLDHLARSGQDTPHMADHASSGASASQSEEKRRSPFPKMEEEISAYWKEEKVFERTLSERSPRKTFVFYDGPPFATGLPHYGHLLQSILKDAVPRYWTMKGYRVPRRWGWDCHGLPVENLIEKELKLKSKRDIEEHGIEKFNAACEASVLRYESDWGKYIDRIGRWVDFKDPYMTMKTDYIESVWWVFSELYKKELVYRGTRVSLYCPRCSTPLSNFEIAMGNSYVDREDPAVFVKFPVKDEEKTYFLAWTTTPWTLPANTGLSVHPELEYVKVRVQETGDTLIFAASRAEDVLKEWGGLEAGVAKILVIERMKGFDLVGKRYEPLYAFTETDDQAYRVVSGTHVTADDGTGIVHTAPAYGEEDLQMAREHSLPILETVDEEGRMMSFCGPFAGVPIKEADPLVINNLRERGLLYRAESITHSVPVCWRCSTLLMYKAQPAWFVNVTSIKDKMLKTAQKINWHPEHFREGRFGKGLETAPDWNISRSRFWGSPIPVWHCDSCEETKVVGSFKELKGLATSGTCTDEQSLHRPHIDHVTIPCSCGGTMKRTTEVFDCWFESGSMPVAQLHYPFEQKKFFESHSPADFIAEGQDQTRGWFYALHVLSTALFNKPAFKNVIVTGMVLAEDGRKMSKSLKNYPDPWELLVNHGADSLRYYLLTSPIVEAEALNFSEKDLQTVTRTFLNLYWNIVSFYKTYAGEGVKLQKPRSGHVMDRWILSRLSHLTTQVTESMDAYDLLKAARPLRDFIDDLSTWWLRRSRDRLKSENDYERNDALKTLREVLEEFTKLCAPFIPFLAEKVYQEIGGMKTSVHLEAWPKPIARVQDTALEADMQWIRSIASTALELRVKHAMPIRQALASLKISFAEPEKLEYWQAKKALLEVLREELNVEAIALEGKSGLLNAWELELDTVLTPDLRKKGYRREFSRHVMALRKQAGLEPKDRAHVLFFFPAGETREAILEGNGSLAKDLRAESVNLVENWVSEYEHTSDVEVGEAKGKVALKVVR